MPRDPALAGASWDSIALVSFPASNPYTPAKDPPPQRDRAPREATAGQRLAGLLLLVNALLVLVEAALSLHAPGAASGSLPAGMRLVPAVIDMAIGATLVSGSGRLVLWATVRVVAGMLVFTAMQLKNPLAAGVQVLVTVSFLLLLVGDAGKPRVAVGASLFGLYALAEVLALVAPLIGANPLRSAVLTASGQIEAGAVHEITGVAYPYTLRFPGDAWRLRKAQVAKAAQPLADRWLTRADKDVHVVTLVEQAPGKVFFPDLYADAIVAGAKRDTEDFVLLDRRPLATEPDGGRFVHCTFTAKGAPFERYYGLYTAGERAFQVIATAERVGFPEVAAELQEIVESLRLPKGAYDVLSDDVERAPAGEVVGVSYPYRITSPSALWHLRKEEAMKKDQPLADRWLTRPDRAAHVMIIAEHAPGAKLPIEAYADQVEANARRAAANFVRIAREPLPSDPLRGRFLHTTGTANGVNAEFYYAVITDGDRAFQIVGFADQAGFASVEKELRQILASFRLPPRAAAVPAAGR
jgi:hypothetical protein